METVRNLRDLSLTPDSGKEVNDTKMISGQAEDTPAESATNVTQQYSTPATKFGKLGWKPSGE